MGIACRMALLFRVKANKLLDRSEDPREVLDYSYQRQLEMLAQVRRGLADVATSRKRIELQQVQLQQSADRRRQQAAEAVTHDREDLAREALTRRAAALAQLDQLRPQHDELAAQEAQLTPADKTAQMRSRALALDELVVSGALDDATIPADRNDDIQAALDAISSSGIASESAQLKSRSTSVIDAPKEASGS
ncbi:PspA/IM30 family protein [Nocardia nepalensis]|uniref:PspA/IM30 family protein n=1 Tax=Nocardia nepalensis TaxID=3375448 RepID=UPI003B67670F